MNLIPYVKVLAVACMSCALGACVMAEPQEADTDEAVEASAPEGDVASTAEAIAQSGGDQSDVIACGGSKIRCIVKCSKTGDNLYYVGSWGELGGVCASPGELYCHAKNLGYRTHACWGHL